MSLIEFKMHPSDTIVALATAPGPALRAIVRLSGPQAFPIAVAHFESDHAPLESAVASRAHSAARLALAVAGRSLRLSRPAFVYGARRRRDSHGFMSAAHRPASGGAVGKRERGQRDLVNSRSALFSPVSSISPRPRRYLESSRRMTMVNCVRLWPSWLAISRAPGRSAR